MSCDATPRQILRVEIIEKQREIGTLLKQETTIQRKIAILYNQVGRFEKAVTAIMQTEQDRANEESGADHYEPDSFPLK